MKIAPKQWLFLPLCLAFMTTACGDDGGEEATTSTASGSTGSPTTDSGSTSDAPTTVGSSSTSDAAESSSEGGEESTGSAATCEVDICATYGAAVPDVSAAIVTQAASDPLFMEDFAPLVASGDKAVQAFVDSLAAFISDAYGCSEGAYTGPSMEAAHTGLDITQEEYDAFLGIIVGVLADAGVPETEITACFAPPLVDPAFVATIVGL
jgi:truncated hemoglobin YjbI